MPVFFYKGGKVVAASQNTDLHGYGEEIRKEIGRLIPRRKKLKVLDVGTGFGINIAFLARWVAKGSEVWTVDPSKEALEEVVAALDKESARLVRSAVATAEDLDFEDGSFDVVVSVMVLHHLEKLQPALREMARVVKPGGRLVVVDYLPKASRDLHFQSRHEESDFFRPEQVGRAVARLGMGARSREFGMWYLVEARKPLGEGTHAEKSRLGR